MNNTFVEAIDGFENMNTEIHKKKIVLFSVLAAAVPCIIQNLGAPVISEIISENKNISVTAMAGGMTLISFLAGVIRLALLIWGGYNITRCKDGTIRFVGIFMLSVTISSFVFGIFDFVESMPLEGAATTYIKLALNVLSDIVGAFINIKLFSIFEYRTENQYVTGAEFSLFRKKMVILIVLAYVLTFVASGISVALIALMKTFSAGQLLTYLISIALTAINMLTLLLVYLLPRKVRGIKSDAIGFGGAYYIAGAVTTPLTLLTTGLSDMFILNMLSSFISVLLSLITGIVSLVIIFKALKIFFPAKEDVPVPVNEDRAERILKNLVASKQGTDADN